MAALRWGLVVVYFLAGLVLLATAVRGFRRTDDRWKGLSFLVFLAGSAAWSLATSAQIAVGGLPAKELFLYARYLAGYLIPPATLVFAVHYTDNEHRLTRPVVAVLVAVPVLAWSVILTDPLHGWFVAGTGLTTVDVGGSFEVLVYDRGPLYWAGQAVSYSLVTIALLLFIRYMLDTGSGARVRVGLLVTGTVTAMGANAVYEFGRVPVDVTPFGYVAFAVVVVVVLERHQFLDVTPVAREHVFRTMDDPVFVLDPGGRVTDANAAGTELLESGDPIDSPAPRVFPAPLVDCLPEEGQRVSTEADLPGPDGESRHYEVGVAPVTTPLDKHVADVVVLHDVTAREERERKLERQNERLDDFASVVSHDLRNPLAVAQGYVETVHRDTGDERLDAVAEELDRMETMIDDVLTLAREGEAVGETQPVNLSGTVAEAWSHVDTPQATLDDRTTATVQADRDRLLTAFENLFRNAIEHGGDDVTVTVEDVDGGFAVADDGPGIPEDRRDEVFDHGYTTNSAGTGFGLSIVSEVVEAHGWSIRVEESDSGGARFVVSGVEAVDTKGGSDPVRRDSAT